MKSRHRAVHPEGSADPVSGPILADKLINLMEERRRQSHDDDGVWLFSFHARKLTTSRADGEMSQDVAE